MHKYKILIADDHELIRRGIRSILELQRDFRVVAEAASGLEAVEKAEKLNPDVAIMDLVMPIVDGVEATRRIRTARPNTRVIVLTMHESEVMVRRALNAGANGYVLKSDLVSQLTVALKAVCRGQQYVSPRISKPLVNRYLHQTAQGEAVPHLGLTARELEVARQLSLGKSSKEIGEALTIRVRTVETHRANMMRKLNVHSVTELLHRAFENKLLEL